MSLPNGSDKRDATSLPSDPVVTNGPLSDATSLPSDPVVTNGALMSLPSDAVVTTGRYVTTKRSGSDKRVSM